jgi:hypothetical protein
MTMRQNHLTARFLKSRGAYRALLALLALLMLSSCALPSLDFLKKKDAEPTAENAEVTPPASAEAGEETPGGDLVIGGEVTGETPALPNLPEGFTLLSAADFSDPAAPLTGLILFASTAPNPFAQLELDTAEEGETHVYAISPDGARAGRISLVGQGADLYTPSNPNAKVRVVQNGFGFSHERVEAAALPAECDPTSNCLEYQLSPTGHSLAYFTGEDVCTRTLTLWDLDGQKVINSWPNAHWMSFNQDGSLMLALGDCDAPYAYFYSPTTGKQAGVEKLGQAFWNPQHTAVIYQVPGKNPLESGLWGFNTETSKVFLWLPKDSVIQDSPIWLPDGQHFVFQHRVIKYVKETNEVILSGPRQIILMNAATRAQSLLSFDAGYDYHLCQSAGEACEQPYEEWLRAYRTPFQPLKFAVDGWDSDPQARCALYGLDCTPAADVLAVNWKERKQFGWGEASVPEAAPLPEAQEPALEAEPIYQAEDGSFALYVGRDNRSLWYAPRDREATLWVKDARGFVYLP